MDPAETRDKSANPLACLTCGGRRFVLLLHAKRWGTAVCMRCGRELNLADATTAEERDGEADI